MDGLLSLEQLAPRDERRRKTIALDAGGQKFSLDIEYLPNRITMEPILATAADEAAEPDANSVTALRIATSFCDVIASWSLTGPLRNRSGEEVVAAGEVIPLEPQMVRLVPTWITTQITQRLIEAAFPNQNASPASPRR